MDDFCLNITNGGSVAVREEGELTKSKKRESGQKEGEKQVKKLKKKENEKKITMKDEKASSKASDDADNASVLKRKKYKSLTKEEDPLHYHLKPRDLDYIVPVNKNEIKASNGDSNHIFSSNPFSSLPLHEKLISLLQAPIEENGFNLSYSTKVQSVIIPLLHKSRSNVLMKSQTGSGKTLAYLLPMLNDLMALTPKVDRIQGTRGLIIAPTRELCSQIADVLNKVTQCCVNIVTGAITGGEKKKSEKARLRKGVVILVCTPGRLLDHLKSTESFNLTKLRWLILDEADRLLDMGFEQTVVEALGIIRGCALPGYGSSNSDAKKPSKITLHQKYNQQVASMAKTCTELSNLVHIMASATLTNSVKSLAMPMMGGENFVIIDADRELVDHIRDKSDLKKVVDLATKEGKNKGVLTMEATYNYQVAGTADDSSNEEVGGNKKGCILDKNEQVETPSQLRQYYMMVTCKWKLAALLSFLKTHSHQKIIVFFVTCDSVDYHSLLLRETDWPTELDPPIDDDAPTGIDSPGLPFVEPLAAKFNGMLGESCDIYRLHGNVPQRLRQEIYKEFCQASNGILLCTDVAARGLDLPKVDWILQYDPPCETTDYVHRIGRTARKGEQGNALIFLLPSEAQYISLLFSHTLYPEQVSLQSLFLEITRHVSGASKFKNKEEMSAVILQRRIERIVSSNKLLLHASRQAYRSFIRAYATHSADAKNIFRVQALHLGHVAKCFGLRDNPNSIKSEEDAIGKIINGDYSMHNVKYNKAELSKDEKKRIRDEKYSLTAISGKKRKATARRDSNDKKQKLRKMSTSSLSASGKFRKSSNGYFRKKLKEQTTSEFSQ